MIPVNISNPKPMTEPNFIKAQSSIFKLLKDVEALEDKYGKATQWVAEKRQVLTDIVNFYDATVDYKNNTDDLIKLTSVNNETLKLMIHKMEDGLPWKKVFKLMGMKPPLAFDLLDQAVDFLNEAEIVTSSTPTDKLGEFLQQVLTKK
jgi:hypothetical protein